MYGEREVVPTREKKTERNRFHKNETVSIFLSFNKRELCHFGSLLQSIKFRDFKGNFSPRRDFLYLL